MDNSRVAVQKRHRKRKRELTELKRLASTNSNSCYEASSASSTSHQYAASGAEFSRAESVMHRSSTGLSINNDRPDNTSEGGTIEDMPTHGSIVSYPSTSTDTGGTGESQVNEDEPEKNAVWLANSMCQIGLQCDVSDNALDKIAKLFLPNLQEIHALYTSKEITTNYRHGIKAKSQFNIPKIRCAVKVRKLEETAEDAVYIKDLRVVPRIYTETKRGSPYVLLRQEAYTTLPEIKKHYVYCHPDLTRDEQEKNMKDGRLSIDGVRESKHGSRTFIIITLMFNGCIHIWKVLNPLKKVEGAKPTIDELLQPLVDELNENPYIVIVFILCDMVERQFIKGMKGHMAKQSCEMCTAIAGPKADWTYKKTTGKERRTNQKFRLTARVRDRKYPEKQGIIAYSPLMDLNQPLDMVMDIPLEEFHLVREGITKAIFQRVLQGKSRLAKASQKKFNETFNTVRVFSEMPRRQRGIEYVGDYKGSEFGLLLLTASNFYFEECLDTTDRYWREVAKCIAAYTFICRSYYQDNLTLAKVECIIDFKLLHRLFYRVYEKEFRKKYNQKVQPNCHAFFHLYEVRKRCGPLMDYSTEPIEAYYAKCGRGYRKGTRGTPAQMMTNMYKADSLQHRCRRKLNYVLRPDSGSANVCDAYITAEDGAWEIIECLDADSFLCREIVLREHETQLQLGQARLPWKLIGVNRFVRFNDATTRTITRHEVTGKIMFCGDYAMEWKLDWMRDSKKEY